MIILFIVICACVLGLVAMVTCNPNRLEYWIIHVGCIMALAVCALVVLIWCLLLVFYP